MQRRLINVFHWSQGLWRFIPKENALQQRFILNKASSIYLHSNILIILSHFIRLIQANIIEYLDHASQFIEKLIEIFLVWIDIMLASNGRLLQKFDKLQFKKVRIFWFMVQNDDSHSCRDTAAHQTGRSVRVRIATNFYHMHSEKNLSRFARL